MSIDFAVGDEVIGFAPRAAQAEYVAVGVDAIAAKPAGLSWEAAATIAGAGATAWASVAAVNPQPGETIVVSAAAGGVGIYAAQLVRLRGADVIGTCGEANVDLLTSLGIRPAQYGPGLSRQLRDLAPNGIDGYIDTFGSGKVSLAISLGVEPHRINTLIDQDAVQRFGVHSEAQEQADTPAIWAELADLVARKSRHGTDRGGIRLHHRASPPGLPRRRHPPRQWQTRPAHHACTPPRASPMTVDVGAMLGPTADTPPSRPSASYGGCSAVY